MRAHARSRKLASDEKDDRNEIQSDVPPSTDRPNEAMAGKGEGSTVECKGAETDEGGEEAGRFYHKDSSSDGESLDGGGPTTTAQASSHTKSRQRSSRSSHSVRSSVDSDKGARAGVAVGGRLGQGEEPGVAVTDAAVGEEKLCNVASRDEESAAACVSRRTSEDTV